MDVLSPKILVIDGRRYRLNTADSCPNDPIETQTSITENLAPYVEKDGEIRVT